MKLHPNRTSALRLGIVAAALLALVALAPRASATEWPSKNYTVAAAPMCGLTRMMAACALARAIPRKWNFASSTKAMSWTRISTSSRTRMATRWSWWRGLRAIGDFPGAGTGGGCILKSACRKTLI